MIISPTHSPYFLPSIFLAAATLRFTIPDSKFKWFGKKVQAKATVCVQVCEMAKSKYEYVKAYERDDEISLGYIIGVRVDGRDFKRFCEVHEFEKPNDKKALDLMNECAKAILKEIPDVVFSYGYSDEYSFILKKDTEFHKRRASKIHSVIGTCFTSNYVSKWKTFFPQKDLKYEPSFRSQVFQFATMGCCPIVEDLQTYLLWRQNECHLNNLYDTCYWELIKSGKTEEEAKETLKLKGSKRDKNELLYQSFNINYNNIPEIFRRGTCTFKVDVCPVKRPKGEITMVHPKNIASTRFWSTHSILMKELGEFTEDLNKIRLKHVTSLQYKCKLPLSNWIVVRIDGCGFKRFTEVHEFEKPNDAEGLNLMNLCAAAVMEEFKDIVFAYGVSDEYSFVFKKDTQLYNRDDSDIVSAVVSFFTSKYTMKWNEFFPHKAMKSLPYFDGRAVCYPSRKILLDYLAWRQVDCHINNQFNSCFWMLVKSGKRKSEAQNRLKGTQAQEKSNLLDRLSEMIDYYSGLPPMFRLGSSLYWDKETKMVKDEEGTIGKSGKRVVVKHCDLIGRGFWVGHPEIFGAFKSKSMPTKDDILDLRFAYPICECNMEAEIKIDVSNGEATGRLFCSCKYDKCKFSCWLEPVSVSWRRDEGERGTPVEGEVKSAKLREDEGNHVELLASYRDMFTRMEKK